MNWYRLEAVRETLRLDYGAVLAPSAIGRPHDELLVPEASLALAAQALRITSVPEFIGRLKARGGLWTGPSPTG